MYNFALLKWKLSDGVIGNTSDSGSEESRFEPWSDNFIINHLQCYFVGGFFILLNLFHYIRILEKRAFLLQTIEAYPNLSDQTVLKFYSSSNKGLIINCGKAYVLTIC